MSGMVKNGCKMGLRILCLTWRRSSDWRRSSESYLEQFAPDQFWIQSLTQEIEYLQTRIGFRIGADLKARVLREAGE
jgi:hypothetical protein